MVIDPGFERRKVAAVIYINRHFLLLLANPRTDGRPPGSACQLQGTVARGDQDAGCFLLGRADHWANDRHHCGLVLFAKFASGFISGISGMASLTYIYYM